MKSKALVVLILIIATSCQTSSNVSNQQSNNQELNDQIKTDKKKQAELDLPFRGFSIDQDLDVIGFASCANQDLPQPIWTTVEKNTPQLMVMLGDNVYASSPEQKPISDQYNKLRKIPEYRSIREKVPFMAIWDDHDYGQNDGGATNPERDEARSQFLKNWPYVKNLLQEDKGALYHSKFFGTSKRRVQVIMLDTRYDRSDLKKNDQSMAEKALSPKPFLVDNDKTKKILSEKQWKWLEAELKKPAELKILSSSIQVIANDHQFEKWGNFPHERERLLNLIKQYAAKNLIIVSGDRHMAAIARTELKGAGTVYELTASSINRPARLGNNMGDSSYLADGYGPINFGLLKINWSTKTTTLEVRGLEDQVVFSQKINFK
jgi:alkaline phosphatase D